MILNNILYTFVVVITFYCIFGEKYFVDRVISGPLVGFQPVLISATVCAMHCNKMDDCVMFQWNDSSPVVS